MDKNLVFIKNLFRIDNFMEATKNNHSYVAFANGIQYDTNKTYNLISMLEDGQFIIGINDFCYFTTKKILSFIEDKIQQGIKLILPENLDLPLQLMPFFISVDSWSKNFISNYIASSHNNVSKYIADIGSSNMIHISKEWSSYESKSLVPNCINYNTDDIFSIIVDQNHQFGII